MVSTFPYGGRPMTRFDTLSADIPNCPIRQFRTEQLGRGMLDYTLMPEGRILRNSTGEVVPFQGGLRLVGQFTSAGGFRVWEYLLTFHNGQLQQVELQLENAPTSFDQPGGGLWGSGSETSKEGPESEPCGYGMRR
jgi:hypothetical protein